MRIQRFIFVLDKVSDQKPYAYPEGGESRYTMLWKIVINVLKYMVFVVDLILNWEIIRQLNY